MLTDEQLIIRIGSELHNELEAIHSPDGFLDGLWEHARQPTLQQRAFASSRSGTIRLFGRLSAGTVAATISVVIAVAIAVGAVFLLHARHHRPSTSSSAQSSFQPLIDTLGVLRRPQTKADLNPALLGIYAPGDAAKIFPNVSPRVAARIRAQLVPQDGTSERALIRVVPVPQLGATVTVIPVKFRSSHHQTSSDAINLILHGPGLKAGIAAALGKANPADARTIRSAGAFVVARVIRGGATAAAVLVPDGVTTVTLGPFRAWNYLPRGKTLALKVDLRNARPVTSRVQENVAVFKLGTISALINHPGPEDANILILAHMTWYYADGRVVKHPLTRLGAWANLHRER